MFKRRQLVQLLSSSPIFHVVTCPCLHHSPQRECHYNPVAVPRQPPVTAKKKKKKTLPGQFDLVTIWRPTANSNNQYNRAFETHFMKSESPDLATSKSPSRQVTPSVVGYLFKCNACLTLSIVDSFLSCLACCPAGGFATGIVGSGLSGCIWFTLSVKT